MYFVGSFFPVFGMSCIFPMEHNFGQIPVEYHKLLIFVICFKTRFGHFGSLLQASFRTSFVTPSKPGALGGPLSAESISSGVKGAIKGSQILLCTPLAFHLYPFTNQAGGLGGGSVGLCRILLASRTRVCFNSDGLVVLDLVISFQIVEVLPCDADDEKTKVL